MGQNCTKGRNYTNIILQQGSILHELQFCTEGNFCMRVKKTVTRSYKKIQKKN